MESLASTDGPATDWPTYALQMDEVHPDTLIYIDAERPELTLSRGQYVSFVKRTAAGLSNAGLRDGSCVALMSRNNIHYWSFADGVAGAGGIFSSLSQHSSTEEISRQLRAVKADWVFAQTEFFDKVADAASEAGIPPEHLYVFDPNTAAAANREHQSLSQLLEAPESIYGWLIHARLNGDSPCVRLMTSGSTGTPKVAEVSHRAMIARQKEGVKLNDTRATERLKLLYMIDMYHASGQMVHSMAVSGSYLIVVTKHNDAASVTDNMSKYGITHTFLFPRLLEDILVLLQRGQRSPDTLRTLQMAMCGGSAVRADAMKLLQAFLPADAVLSRAYGSTEAGAVTNPTSKPHPEFDGTIHPQVEVMQVLSNSTQHLNIVTDNINRIVDRTTLEDAGQDTEGEVCCRSPMMFSGYFGNEQATEDTFIHNSKGKWFRTGDRGWLCSKRGLLSITGRYKEVFKVIHDEVAPEEVEARLMTHPAVIDAAVSAVSGRRQQGDLEPGAVVVSSDPSLTGQDLVKFVAENSAAYKAPTGGVMFVDVIPRNASGKVLRYKAREMLEGCTPRAYLDLPML